MWRQRFQRQIRGLYQVGHDGEALTEFFHGLGDPIESLGQRFDILADERVTKTFTNSSLMISAFFFSLRRAAASSSSEIVLLASFNNLASASMLS